MNVIARLEFELTNYDVAVQLLNYDIMTIPNFLIGYNINVFRANDFSDYLRSIWLIDGTLTGTTTPGQSVPGSNTTPFPDFQDWSLTTRGS